MSCYYTYYLAKREKATGKVFPAPPFSASGEPIWLLSTSRSFSSDLPEYMDFLPEKDLSEELKAFFSYEGFGSKVVCPRIRIIALSELSGEDPFCTAYVPVTDLVEGIDSDVEGFSDKLSPENFAAFCLAHERNPQVKRKTERYNPDTDLYDVVELAPGDYMRHMWVDKCSREYQEWLIATEARNIGDTLWEERSKYEYVILMTVG